MGAWTPTTHVIPTGGPWPCPRVVPPAARGPCGRWPPCPVRPRWPCSMPSSWPAAPASSSSTSSSRRWRTAGASPRRAWPRAWSGCCRRRSPWPRDSPRWRACPPGGRGDAGCWRSWPWWGPTSPPRCSSASCRALHWRTGCHGPAATPCPRATPRSWPPPRPRCSCWCPPDGGPPRPWPARRPRPPPAPRPTSRHGTGPRTWRRPWQWPGCGPCSWLRGGAVPAPIDAGPRAWSGQLRACCGRPDWAVSRSAGCCSR